MSGNVGEWCKYDDKYKQGKSDMNIVKGGNIYESCKSSSIKSIRYQKNCLSAGVIGFRVIMRSPPSA